MKTTTLNSTTTHNCSITFASKCFQSAIHQLTTNSISTSFPIKMQRKLSLHKFFRCIQSISIDAHLSPFLMVSSYWFTCPLRKFRHGWVVIWMAKIRKKKSELFSLINFLKFKALLKFAVILRRLIFLIFHSIKTNAMNEVGWVSISLYLAAFHMPICNNSIRLHQKFHLHQHICYLYNRGYLSNLS